MTQEKKHNLQIILGFSLAVFGMILLSVSLFLPPLGIIHTSVLTAIGEIFTFSGALIGIDYHYKIKYMQYQQEIKTNKLED